MVRAAGRLKSGVSAFEFCLACVETVRLDAWAQARTLLPVDHSPLPYAAQLVASALLRTDGPLPRAAKLPWVCRRWANVELFNCRSFVRELATRLAADAASVDEAFDNVFRFVVLEREAHGDRVRG